MRIHDGLIGAVLLLLSLAVLWHVQSFPPAPGQDYGPAVFPGLIAAGLALASIALILQGFSQGQAWLTVGKGLRSGRHLLAFAVVLLGSVAYVLLVDRLGFIICSLALLISLQWACGVRWGLNIGVALIATLAIHAAFYKLLKVPLPWGLLDRLAW